MASLDQIGVVIPTLNCLGRLSDHWEASRHWLEKAGSLIVVDSYSTDGTWAFANEVFKPLGAKLIQRPKGLYASWNEGIVINEKPWTYISTIGDLIDEDGLIRLLQSGDRHKADVVISPPRLVDEKHDRLPESPSTLELIIRERAPEGPFVLTPETFWAWVAWFAIAGGMNTPLGSAASNLYRTEVLKALPFPCCHGSAGDAFWGIRFAHELKVVVDPNHRATFMVHTREHEWLSRNQLDQWYEQAWGILTKTIEERFKEHARALPARLDMIWSELQLRYQLQQRIHHYQVRFRHAAWHPGYWLLKCQKRTLTRRQKSTFKRLARMD